nr:hypothetical protein [Chloroflexota bacterium]
MRRAFSLLFPLTFIVSCGGGLATAPATSSAPPAITIIAPQATLAPVGVTLVAPAGTPAPDAPSPTPEQVVGPDTYPPGINPLTGLPADAAALNRRPLAV